MAGKNKLVKNYIYNTLYQILVLVSPLITTPYVSRVLGATGIGIYSYSQSIATYFVLVGAVGTTLYGQREIAYVQNDPKRRTEVFWEVELFRIAAVLVCTAAYYLIFGISGEYAVIYRILTFEVLANAFDISWFFMGMENFKTTVIRNTIIKLVGIALIFILVKSPEDVPLYTVCLTIPIFIGNISLWFNLKKYLVKFGDRERKLIVGIRSHLKPILILFVPQIATEVYVVLDKTMLGILGSDIDQVGYYTQSQKIVKIVLMVVTSLGTVMLPAMAAAFANGDKERIQRSIGRAFSFTFMLSFAMVFGLAALSSRFVPVFFGPGYDPVVYLMIIISPILVIIGMSNVLGKQYLLPTKQQGAYTASVVTGAAVNFVLNIILIHFLDATGASIATVIAEIAVTAVQCWYVRHQLPLGRFLLPAVKYFVMGVIMFVCVTLAGKLLEPSLGRGILSICVMICVGVVIYLLELIITRDENLKFAYRLVGRK